jgi:hypothetical protein
MRGWYHSVESDLFAHAEVCGGFVVSEVGHDVSDLHQFGIFGLLATSFSFKLASNHQLDIIVVDFLCVCLIRIGEVGFLGLYDFGIRGGDASLCLFSQ